MNCFPRSSSDIEPALIRLAQPVEPAQRAKDRPAGHSAARLKGLPLGQLLQPFLGRLRPAHAEHLIPGAFGNASDGLPGALHRAQVLNDLAGPLIHRLAVRIHGELGGAQRVPLLVQGGDLLVHRGSQVVVLLVELLRRPDRVFGQLGELGHRFGNGLASGVLHGDRGTGHQLDLIDRELAGGGDLRQYGHGLILGAVRLRDRSGHRGEAGQRWFRRSCRSG